MFARMASKKAKIGKLFCLRLVRNETENLVKLVMTRNLMKSAVKTLHVCRLHFLENYYSRLMLIIVND